MKPDLALVDLSLEDGSGLELIRACREIAPDTRVLVLSMHDEAPFAERALRAGARGYLMKREAIDGLGHAIQEILAGRLVVSARMSQHLLERLGTDAPATGNRLGNLTDRELEVFELIGSRRCRSAGSSSSPCRCAVRVMPSRWTLPIGASGSTRRSRWADAASVW